MLEVNHLLSPESREAGQIRKKQNWISSSKKKITYTPPLHQEVENLLLNVLDFINNIDFPPLTRAITAHSQLALIHPFCDGNGRVARVLWDAITEKAQLSLINPMIYRLQNSKAPYTNAVHGFGLKSFKGVAHSFWQQSIDWGEGYKKQVKPSIQETHHQIQSKTMLMVLTDNGEKVLDYLWSQPIIHTNNLIHAFKWNNSECIRVITELQEYGLLTARRIKHPIGEIVYENEEILELWQSLESTIFA